MKRDIKLRDFVLNTENDSILTDFRYIENKLSQYIDLIIEADSRGLTYINIASYQELINIGLEEEIIEIGWEYK